MVKNTFELYPGGLQKAIAEFDKAFEWAVQYSFCSLADFEGRRNSLILQKSGSEKLLLVGKKYKEFARTCMLKVDLEEKLKPVIFKE